MVFGGSNIHVVKPNTLTAVDAMAVRRSSHVDKPEWSTASLGLFEPGNLRGFKTKWMKRAVDHQFLDVTTSMLPNGIPFPVIPERRRS